jgi:chromatin structure-remodeling complex subunit RSC1/2
MGGTSGITSHTAPTPVSTSHHSQFAQHPVQYNQHSATPTPTYQQSFQSQGGAGGYGSHATPGFTPGQHGLQQYSASAGSYQHHSYLRPGAPGYSYNPPKPAEVYHLSDALNLAIPADIREQFQTDDQGRVLFFTTPPLDPLNIVKPGQILGHSEKYEEAKQKRLEAIAAKRKLERETGVDAESLAKKRKTEEEALAAEVNRLTTKGLALLGKQIANGTESAFEQLYGKGWQSVVKTG